MAIVVDFEDVITPANRMVDGVGTHFITNACPDLLALTTSSGDARALPIGWRVQYLRDSNTGEEKGVVFRSPDGRTWDMEKCTAGAVVQEAGWWTWLGVLGLGALFYWVYTKKGK